ncbi:MAG: hypothetical protein NTW96_16790 [Planctomycetia bacterium]|nr:hypothetical protein [Planctomycetia bacterium]
MHALHALALALATCGGPNDMSLDPMPRPVVATETLCQWDFDRDADGWQAQHHCTLSTTPGTLVVESLGDDPYFHRAVDLPGGELTVTIRAKSLAAADGTVYWGTDQAPGIAEARSSHFAMKTDGQWHEYTRHVAAPGKLTELRIDPGSAPGKCEIDWIRVQRRRLHPLAIEQVENTGREVRFTVKNHGSEPVEFTALGSSHALAAGATVELSRPIRADVPLEAASIELQPSDGKLPPVSRPVFLFHPDVATDWIARPLDGGSLEVAPDGTAARVVHGGKVVAAIGPLVHVRGKIPRLKRVETPDAVKFEGDGVTLTLATHGLEIEIAIRGQEACEGPVVRALGGLEQGLLAGVEYLGKGERSSSKLDIETDEHRRYAPEPRQVTMPLMVLATDRATVSMTWSDMRLQPTYATPNFVDLADDHRMALEGKSIDATIRVDDSSVEEAVLWAVQRSGLPPLPNPPRDARQQAELCQKALEGPLKNKDGWGHCAGESWGRAPYADMGSTVWRLTGQIPELPRLVPGGAHVANDAIYFITGRAGEWLERHRQQVQGILRNQLPDGSFHYDGKYRRGHFENTASGICALPAAQLLDFARYTGDAEAKAAGLRTLDYMKRFQTPRGAQTWEVPLHTPDQLASAYLVRAYVLGYELTGDAEYLKQARRWALSGVPFVYLWSDRPTMLYATTPVLGATNWVAPNWIGLPVQWVGGVYAYSLTLLAPYDKTLDWNHLARGILISAQQQQYPDGPNAGLLPDSFALDSQTRRGPDINPCALVSLETVLDGRLDSLAVATDEHHRVVAPFPVTLDAGAAHVKARKGLRYQLLIDGQRVVDVESKGDDVVPVGKTDQ